MSIVIVIPARFASTRLPSKMLLDQTGWPLIRHTYEQAKKSKLADRVIIATDDARIATVIEKFGGTYVMTDVDHPTGTDRLAEVAAKYLQVDDIVINVQGDEPELDPENIDMLIRLFQASNAHMATLVTPFANDKCEGIGSPHDPNCVKAVLGAAIKEPLSDKTLGYHALYFSRSIIPYPRDQHGAVSDPRAFFMHLGIYAYNAKFLKTYLQLPQGRLEQVEKLEQLRLLEQGYGIVAGVVNHATPGIDTQADYDHFVQRWLAKEAMV